MKPIFQKSRFTPLAWLVGVLPYAGPWSKFAGLCNWFPRACNTMATAHGLFSGARRVRAAANGAMEDEDAANAKLVTASLEEAGETPVLCAANAADGWIKLMPYNTYPHPVVGPQVVNKDTVEQMAANLRGAWAKVKQVLSYFTGVSAALPVYNGHPDDPHFAANGHNDWNTYARVPEVQAREDGMWINVQYEDLGRKLLASGQKLYFSPRWAGRAAANGDFLPRKLLSFGLFPNPNIKEAAAANAQTQTTMNPLLKAILAALGFNNEQATTAANAQADAVETSEPLKKLNDLVTNAGKVAGLQTDLTAANGKVDKLTTDLATAKTAQSDAETKLTTVSNAARDGLIALAIEDARLPKADEAKWKGEFDKDFVTAANGLRALKRGTALKTAAKTRDLSQGRDVAVSNAADKFNDIVARIRKENPKLTRDQAWARAKKDPEGKAAYELMSA